MDMYHYIRKNRGVIAVCLHIRPILTRFKFTSGTEALKKAVESSIEKCIALDFVDELLKSDVSVLYEVFYILHASNQSHIAAHFLKEYPQSDNKLYEYTHAANNCKEPIPCNAKLHQNINTIINILIQCRNDGFIYLKTELQDKDAISEWHSSQISYLWQNNKQEAARLLLAMITNKYQYDQFKACCNKYCKEVLPYL